jgi:hypothetical protein
MSGMATKERVIQLIESLPDTPETDLRLDSVVEDLEPNGAGASSDDQPADERPVLTLQEVSEIFASVDFLPREDAWH